jgi:hypothetical protein
LFLFLGESRSDLTSLNKLPSSVHIGGLIVESPAATSARAGNDRQ